MSDFSWHDPLDHLLHQEPVHEPFGDPVLEDPALYAYPELYETAPPPSIYTGQSDRTRPGGEATNSLDEISYVSDGAVDSGSGIAAGSDPRRTLSGNPAANYYDTSAGPGAAPGIAPGTAPGTAPGARPLWPQATNDAVFGDTAASGTGGAEAIYDVGGAHGAGSGASLYDLHADAAPAPSYDVPVDAAPAPRWPARPAADATRMPLWPTEPGVPAGGSASDLIARVEPAGSPGAAAVSQEIDSVAKGASAVRDAGVLPEIAEVAEVAKFVE